MGHNAYVGFADGSVEKCQISNFDNNQTILTVEDQERLAFDTKLSEDKKELEVKHTDYVSAIAYLKDSKSLVTAGADKLIQFSDLEGVVKKKTQKFKKIIDFMIIIERPLSLYKSTLTVQKAKKTHQIFTSFKK